MHHRRRLGHKKGAFTGAISDRLGKVALAEGGTLFLDEIGDVKADHQIKLPRAKVSLEGAAGIRGRLQQEIDDAKRRAIREALAATNGNKSQAARIIGISRRTLFNWMDELGMAF